MRLSSPSLPWLLIVALLLGTAIGAVLDPLRDWLLERYDDAHPVIVMQTRIVSREPGRLVLSVKGEKLRNCQYVPTANGAGSVPGEPDRDLRITRLDKPVTGTNRKVGPIAEQKWEVLDVDGVQAVTIWVSYDCGGRYVVNKFAEAKP
jgi:hypothetical protein